MAATMRDLPDELLLHVLDCIDPNTLFYTIRLVSRLLKACVEDSLRISLRIQLQAIAQAVPGDKNQLGLLCSPISFRGRTWLEFTTVTPRKVSTCVLDWKRLMVVYFKGISYDKGTISKRNLSRYLPWTLISKSAHSCHE